MYQGKTKEADNFSMNLTWVDYTEGFGLRSKDFYVGNKHVHEMVSGSRTYRLKVQLFAFLNNSFNVQLHYEKFRVGNEKDKFRITTTPMNGNKNKWHGDALFSGNNATQINGSYFSTYDNDNDGNTTINCAQNYGGGWWFGTGCSDANVNGQRILSYSNWNPSAWPQLSWGTMSADITGFKASEMQIYPHPYKAPNYLLVI
jgi:ficolin